jgi:hypothetical protein
VRAVWVSLTPFGVRLLQCVLTREYNQGMPRVCWELKCVSRCSRSHMCAYESREESREGYRLPSRAPPSQNLKGWNMEGGGHMGPTVSDTPKGDSTPKGECRQALNH